MLDKGFLSSRKQKLSKRPVKKCWVNLKDLKGDDKVVNILRTGMSLLSMLGKSWVSTNSLANDGIIEIRVQTGRIGYKKEFESGSDPILTKILDFCKKHRYIQISENMRDDQFFK